MALPGRVGRLAPMLGVAVLHFGGYLVVTEAALRRPASELWHTATRLDAYVPHLPWTWPFYWAAYPFILAGGAAVLLRLREASYRRAIAALAVMAVAGATIQIAVPAQSPWPHLGHPAQSLIHWSRFERGFATLPSMHVAFSAFVAVLAGAAFRSLAVRSLYAFMAAAISLSTVTLQEHVILDVVAGAALGGFAALWWRIKQEDVMPSLATPDPGRLYRLPWTASDNAMTWLEPTRRCNITCDACFAENDPRSQKTLAQIRHELAAMLRLRRCDAMLIAGGEPLTHPEIEAVVRMVKDTGVKPVLVTNGVLLDRSLLRRLKQAGAYGFTLHVDSHQSRPGWIGRSESELNALRDEFAEMLHAEGDLTCAFNTTIFPDTLREVPEIVRWAIGRPDKVQILTLICVRMAEVDGAFAYQSGGRLVDIGSTPYASREHYTALTTDDIYREIRKVIPDFELCAYLGGTVHPLSLKWVIGCALVSPTRVYGSAGPRMLELAQTASHLTRRRFLAYTTPRTSRMGKLTLLLGLVDSELRKAARRFASAVLRDPRELLRPLYLQSLSIVQPVDILPNGEMDTCDGCPNKTYWCDRLVPACRLDEYKRFGGPLQAVPREAEPGGA